VIVSPPRYKELSALVTLRETQSAVEGQKKEGEQETGQEGFLGPFETVCLFQIYTLLIACITAWTLVLCCLLLLFLFPSVCVFCLLTPAHQNFIPFYSAHTLNPLTSYLGW